MSYPHAVSFLFVKSGLAAQADLEFLGKFILPLYPAEEWSLQDDAIMPGFQ